MLKGETLTCAGFESASCPSGLGRTCIVLSGFVVRPFLHSAKKLEGFIYTVCNQSSHLGRSLYLNLPNIFGTLNAVYGCFVCTLTGLRAL
jgi:hypothetical protein